MGFLPDAAVWPEPTRRFLAALLASAAAHAAVLFLPYLGVSQPPAPGQLRDAPRPRQALTVSVFAAAPAGLEGGEAAAAAMEPMPARQDKPAEPPGDPLAGPQPPPPEESHGLDLLPLPAPAYYTTDQLTKHPQPAVLAELETPETRPLVASGRLVLKLWIDELGRVAEVTVEHSELPEVFARTAVESFKRSRFLPGEKHGQRVPTVMRIEVSYDDGRAAAAR